MVKKRKAERFPLFLHKATGQWCKKRLGKFYYFGTDKDAALKRFVREWVYIREGRTPPPERAGDSLTVADMCNHFLDAKNRAVEAGELSPRSFRDYFETCRRLTEHFRRDRIVDDMRPADFGAYRLKLGKKYQAVALGNEIVRVKTVFKFAADNDHLERPVNFGSEFNRPKKKTITKAKRTASAKLFSHAEVVAILGAVEGQPVMKAIVHLGLNCGFGNSDIATLRIDSIDLKAGIVTHERSKTEVDRRIPLWPETVAAVKAALPLRPTPKGKDSGLAFLTETGRPLVRIAPGGKDKEGNAKPDVHIDRLTPQFRAALDAAGIKRRVGFYAFRHTFETIAGDCQDQVAVDAVMGHSDASMAANYRHGISDDRLRAAVNQVRAWAWTN